MGLLLPDRVLPVSFPDTRDKTEADEIFRKSRRLIEGLSLIKSSF